MMVAPAEYPRRQTRHNQRRVSTFALLITIASVLSLRRDSAPLEPQALIAFMGIGAPERDTSYQRFMTALDQSPPQKRQRLRVVFVESGLATPQTRIEAARHVASLNPRIVVAPSSATAKMAKERLQETPIIFGSFLDPVRYGLVSSMESRREQMTGVWVADTLDEKRLEILRDAYPSAKRIAVLIDRPWGQYFESATKLPAVGSALGLEVSVLFAEDAKDARALLEKPSSREFDAWCLPRTGLAGLNTSLIVERLRRWGKPVIIANTPDMASGAPLSYALDMSFAWPAIAELVYRVLDGEDASSIPVLRPQRAVLAVRPDPPEGFPPPAAAIVRRADVVLR